MSFTHNPYGDGKAKSNKAKHKVAFEEAVEVFKDAMAQTLFDEENSNYEEIWITLGKVANTSILLVVHTYIEYNENQADIRIISARKATAKEKQYYQNKGK